MDLSTSTFSEIKKFEDQLAKDPKSYCFAPLADLYRKLGLLDEAISVAQRGVELHPSYVGGLVSLAKAYFEKGQKQESRAVLERLVTITPENLMAQKLLAQTCLDTGDIAAAEKAFQVVLALNPADSESRIALDSLAKFTAPAKAAPVAPSAAEAVVAVEAAPAASLPAQPKPMAIAPEPDGSGAKMVDLLEGGEFDITFDDADIVSEVAFAAPELTEAASFSWTSEVVEDQLDIPGASGLELDQSAESPEPAEIDGETFDFSAPPTLVPPPAESDFPVFGELAEALGGEHDLDFFGLGAAEAEPGLQTTTFFGTGDEVGSDEEQPAFVKSEPVGQKDPLTTVTLAELYVSQGFLTRALNIYRELVDENPQNQELKNRLRELTQQVDAAEDSSKLANQATAAETQTVTEIESNETVVVTSPMVAPVQMMTTTARPDAAAVEIASLQNWLDNIRRNRQCH